VVEPPDVAVEPFLLVLHEWLEEQIEYVDRQQ
jgi:hypothetical protein